MPPSEVGGGENNLLDLEEKTEVTTTDYKLKDGRAPNERIPLPWHLYWNDETQTDGTELNRFEYEDKVKSWVALW